MELTWVLKIRLAAAAVLGIVIIGFLAFPLVQQPDPYSVISLTAGRFTIEAVLTLAALALVCGILGFFASWPYGKEIGIFAVPSGLSVWAIRTGSVANLIQSAPLFEQRLKIYNSMKWEPLFWLIIVLLGFVGVNICQMIFKPEHRPVPHITKKEQKLNVYVRIVVAVLASIVFGKICISVFVQDVTFVERNLGTFVGQPVVAQIVFGVFIAFLITAFLVTKFLDLGYIWPIIATAFVIPAAVVTSLSKSMMESLVEAFPANVFPDAALAVLPVQIVAFGTIGAIAGYWTALRYMYWREHEID
ncbi:MAG: hypothetical protein ACYSSP_09825 [Planctomycetota bacterium]